MKNPYQQVIAERLGVEPREAAIIEAVLRVETPTLDHLSRLELVLAAEAAQEVLAELRQVDPDAAAWYERQAA